MALYPSRVRSNEVLGGARLRKHAPSDTPAAEMANATAKPSIPTSQAVGTRYSNPKEMPAAKRASKAVSTGPGTTPTWLPKRNPIPANTDEIAAVPVAIQVYT